MLYRFDNLELDLDAFELRRDGTVIPIRKKTFDLLRYLIEHQDRVVTKYELLDKLWVGEHVNESTIPWYISNLRKTLEQKRGDRYPVETVHGRGYRFKSEIQIIEKDAQESEYYSLRPTGIDIEPFVGREEIMGHLIGAIDSIVAGRGKILVLRGEAGIGKTRCATELSNHIDDRKVGVWMGRCQETLGQPSFWPWIQILRNAAGELRGDSSLKPEITRLLSFLVPSHQEASGSKPSDIPQSKTDRFWLYDRLHGFLRGSSASDPRILIIDDIHWADEASLEFLSFIAPDVGSLRILFLLTLREYEEMGSRAGHLHRLLRYAEQIPLTGLSQDNVDQYISQSGKFEITEDLTRAFYTKTGGNPLFMHETFRWLLSTCSKSKKELTVVDLQNLNVPDVIKELLVRRLDTVDPETRRVLDLASVIGRQFDLGLISQTLEQDRLSLVAALDQATDMGLVTKESALSFRFSHDYITEVAYEMLPGATRAEYHKRIAEALLNKPDRDAIIGKVAFHLHKALPLSDIELTISCAKKAAILSASIYAHGDAATFYRMALDAMTFSSVPDPRVQAELMFLLSQQERYSGDVEQSIKTVEETLRLARNYAYFDIVVNIAFLSRVTFLTAYLPEPVILEAMEEAVERVPEENKALRSQLLSKLALMHPYSVDMSLCKKYSEQAVQLAKEIGHRKSIRIALNATLYSLSGPDDIDAMLQTADQIIDMNRQRDSSYHSGEALLARIICFIHRGDMAEAERAIEAYGMLIKRLQRSEGVWLYHRLLAQIDLHQGKLEKAEVSFTELLQRGRSIGIYYADVIHVMQKGHVLRARQDSADKLSTYCPTTLEMHRAWPLSLSEVVGLVVQMGFPELCRNDYTNLVAEEFENIPRNFIWLNSMANLARAAVAYDDLPRIRKLYELLSPYADFNTPDGIFLSEGSVAHFLGMLAAKLKLNEKVIFYFEQAIEANRRMKAYPHLVRSQVCFAEWLAAVDPTKYLVRLKSLRDEAREGAKEMGMVSLLNRVEALKLY